MLVLLCIMDGFGLRQPTSDNAVAAARKPNYDKLMNSCPHTVLDGSGPAVGLPPGQMGNSEVGHLNLGAGRVVYQDITRIDKAIDDGTFFDNNVFVENLNKVKANNQSVHLMGLVSDGCVHSSLKHLYALAELCRRKKIDKVYLHAFMDGRDTSPTAGIKYMQQVLDKFKELGVGKVASVCGRYFGLDRDKRWDRTNKAYRAFVYGEGERFDNPLTAIKSSYDKNVTDEFIVPVVIELGSADSGRIQDGDLVIFFNFRADRARQLSHMLVRHDVSGFMRESDPRIDLVSMTMYDVKLPEAQVAFTPIKLNNILGEVLSRAGKKQLRTAETEKYAHVTFFFNGGVEKPFEGEDRDLIPSPKVATYDLKPEMSAYELTDNAVRLIESGKYEFVMLNYANPDMVGHTGVFEAAKKAVEVVDEGVGKLVEAVKNQKGVAIITSDHGNAESMIDPETGGPWTAHTTNLVPCIICDPTGQLKNRGKFQLREKGILADIAPTALDILGMAKPKEMTGASLIIWG
ncbi:MAG: 2,3-bisphosphoglycerate-independent phosphoglycerate mutase [Candidatus Zixiibacteriota bacterium]